MERINLILRNELFLNTLKIIDAIEIERRYCGHGEEHLLSVARTAALIASDNGIKIDRELLYASALLHDLGRADGQSADHELRSAKLADKILEECGFNPDEKKIVITAISEHRSSWSSGRSVYGQLLYRADKESRACFACPVSSSCNWPESKKNLVIGY